MAAFLMLLGFFVLTLPYKIAGYEINNKYRRQVGNLKE